MKRFSSVGLILLLWLAQALAQVGDAAADKSKLIALENAWNQAQIHRDGKALNELVADNFGQSGASIPASSRRPAFSPAGRGISRKHTAVRAKLHHYPSLR